MGRWHERRADGTVVLFVHAHAGAKRTEVRGLHGDALKISVAAPALEDRANSALIEFIAERLGVSRRDVTLASGAKSREKRFEIQGNVDPARLLDAAR